MREAVLAFLIVATVQAHAVVPCALTVIALNERGERIEPALIAPDDVESTALAPGNDEHRSETLLLLLRLKPDARRRLATFTRSNIGRQMVIACHDVEVSRPFVNAQIESGVVVVSLPAPQVVER